MHSFNSYKDYADFKKVHNIKKPRRNILPIMNLDDYESFSQIDSENILAVLSSFPDQIAQSQTLVQDTSIPRLYDVNHILFTGAGENGLAALLLAEYLKDRISIPVSESQSDTLPKWVNKHTLVISISYDGEREETNSSFKQAIQKHCKIIAITSNGHLKQYCEHRNLPMIVLPKGYPSRFTLGFLFFATLFSLQKTGLLQLSLDSDIQETISVLQDMKKTMLPSIPTQENTAKQLARQIQNSTPLFFGWDLYSVVAKRWTMQCNQNAKQISHYYPIPESMYYALVGWANQPSESHHYKSVLFRDHQMESKEMKKRLQFLERFYNDVTDEIITVNPLGKSVLAKLFSVIYIGDFMSVYSALSNDVNPSSTPILHQLDEELTRM